MRSRTILILLLAAVVLCGLAGRAEAASYSSSDVLFVAYQPHGREFIVNLGPASTFLGATGPVDVTQFTAADISGIYGGTLPADLKLAVFAANGADGYLATNGPSSPSLVGSAIGAANQIRFLGANFVNLSTPVSGNPNAGTFEFGAAGSYQSTLDRIYPGSLGNNVPFNAEGPLPAGPALAPFYQAQFNPFAGIPATQSQLGNFQVQADGTLRYFPKRSMQVSCYALPQILDPRSHGDPFVFFVFLKDVTDPAHPTSVNLSRMDPAYLTQIGSTALPVPYSGPGCGPEDDGIWETLSERQWWGIRFLEPSDGNCSTLDGNRQDIIGVLGRDRKSQPICFASSVEGNPVSCCDNIWVINKTRR